MGPSRTSSRRQWGWHRLDARWAERLVAEAGVQRGDLVLDIGAGDGAITAPLLEAGARVIAIEAHPHRAALLRERFDGRGLTVVRADAADLRLPRRAFSVVASLPYSATSDVLRRLLHPGSRLRSAHVIVQEEAARRWAGPVAPAAGRWQRDVEPSLGSRVPRSAFRPAPNVDSRVLILRDRSSRTRRPARPPS